MNNKQLKRFKAELIFKLYATRRPRADEWEEIVAHALNGDRKLSDNYLADVVAKTTMLSVKSRYLRPKIFKSKPSTDIHTNPISDVMVWERRIQTDPALDLDALTAEEISEHVLTDYREFELRSLDHYNCDRTLDFCIIHGEDISGKLYLVRLIVNKHDAQFDIQPIIWKKKNFSERSKNTGLNCGDDTLPEPRSDT